MSNWVMIKQNNLCSVDHQQHASAHKVDREGKKAEKKNGGMNKKEREAVSERAKALEQQAERPRQADRQAGRAAEPRVIE